MLIFGMWFARAASKFSRAVKVWTSYVSYVAGCVARGTVGIFGMYMTTNHDVLVRKMSWIIWKVNNLFSIEDPLNK